MKEKNPLKFTWNLLRTPMAVLGLLSMSDTLISFHKNIQELIDIYHSLVYPIFYFIFGWLWFDIPEAIFDYLFLGFLFASNERKVWGFYRMSKNTFIYILLHIYDFLRSVIFWPIIVLRMIWDIAQTDSDGIYKDLAKQPEPMLIEYTRRNKDISVFSYIGAVLLIFSIILILNQTYLRTT